MDAQRIRGNQNVQIQEVENSWIYVSIDGSPRRVLPLESPELSIASDRPSPARLVSARAGVFGYVGHGALLKDLEAWIDSEAPYAAQVVAGPGGSGKTRLAVELCQRLREWDWLCGFLARGDGEGRLDALIETPAPRLVVIDYAENRADQLALLLPQLSASASDAEPVRVLLLVRTGAGHSEDTPARLGARVESVEQLIEGCGVRVLAGDERLDLVERAQLFDGAAVAFGEYVTTEATIAAPPDFDQQVFENPLMVVIAAYLAAHGEQAPSSREALLDEVLRHEHRYWQRAKDLDVDDALLERVVAVATLISAESEQQAAEHLRLLADLRDASMERRGRLARWASDQYPGPRWWNPLEPDLVGEHLVARCFTADPAALRGALAADDPEEITRPLEVLARAAVDHPALANALAPILSEGLDRLCGIAVAQAESVKDTELLHGNAVTIAAALDTLLSVVEVDPEAVRTAVQLLPPRSDVVLNELSATLSALEVGRLRSLAAADPDTHAPEFAMALNNHGVRLAASGRLPEALSATQESLGVWVRLADSDSEAHARYLAGAFNNVSNRLADTGRYAEALIEIEKSVEVWRPLAEARPDLYAADLAMALNNLSNRLSEAGRHPEALGTAEKSVEAWRPLVAVNPGAHAPELAKALSNLSNRLSEAGRHPEALEATEESVGIRRPLAEANPAAFAPDLAIALLGFSSELAAVGRLPEALEIAEKSVQAWRPLAEANPAHASYLATALNNLSIRRSEVGRYADALAASEESVAVWRPLVDAAPAANTHNLAGALNNLANRLAAVGGRDTEALEANEESVKLRRRLAAGNPAAHAPNLAGALNNISVRLSAVGREAEALAAIEESVGAWRALAEDNPVAHASNLASALNNLSIRLSDGGRDSDALEACEESVAIWHSLEEGGLVSAAPNLAGALDNLSVRLGQVGRESAALAESEKSVQAWRPLAAANPGYAPNLGGALNNLSVRLAAAGHLDDALAAIEESVDVWRGLAGTAPNAHTLDLARTLRNLARRLSDAGREEEAAQVVEEATERLASLNPPDDEEEGL